MFGSRSGECSFPPTIRRGLFKHHPKSSFSALSTFSRAVIPLRFPIMHFFKLWLKQNRSQDQKQSNYVKKAKKKKAKLLTVNIDAAVLRSGSFCTAQTPVQTIFYLFGLFCCLYFFHFVFGFEQALVYINQSEEWPKLESVFNKGPCLRHIIF